MVGEAVVIGGDNLLFPVGVGLIDLLNIGGAPWPPFSSAITAVSRRGAFILHVAKLVLILCLFHEKL